MSEKILISLKDVNKFYGKKHVLQNINLDIKEGDRIAFLGGNGSGKSTTMEIIARVRDASSGTITYDKNLVIGIQFQESNYPMGVTAKALIDFNLNRYSTDITKEKVQELLKVFRLESLYKKQLMEMSGGQKQRLNILLALIHKPNFLILDELSTGLDIKVRRELRAYINKYLDENPKTSLILVTHSMGEAQEMTNRVVVLDWGVIKQDRQMKDIIKEHGSLEKYANIIFDEMYDPKKEEEMGGEE